MVFLRKEIANHVYDGAPGVKLALQIALRLEHATIPPYLYALYSLKPGSNFEIAQILRSIVLEEMSHMAIVCNILNALGCTPVIDDPCFVPRYPDHLPGAVAGGVVLSLQPFSKALLREVFAVIEEPEDGGIKGAFEPMTIGQYYREIQQQLRMLSQTQFRGIPERQLRTGFGPLQTIRVSDADSAVAAISEIVDQGEGAKKTAFDEEGELAHYYRLVEIYHGRKLIADVGRPLEGSHSIEDLAPLCRGHQIQFDAQGVWPAISNPTSTAYDQNARATAVNREFNRTYTRLLATLQEVFSGSPDRLAVANTLMRSLTDLASDLFSTRIQEGRNAGPTFEYTS